MGLIKGIGSMAGKLAGGVIGGTVGVIGEISDSNFIKEIGEGIYQVSSRSGELIGNLAEGAVDTVSGMISDDDNLKSKGKKQLVNAAGDTIKGVASGVTTVTKKGINTASAILDGDKEKAIECAKDLVKIAAVGALSIGVIDVIDGLDGFDGLDDVEVSDAIEIEDSYDTVDIDFDDDSIENPNMHSVSPHWRTLPDGREIWVDGDGDTSVNTGDGWIQHNPDYKISDI